jgi:hypothetical protein
VVFVILPDRYVSLRGYDGEIERNIVDPHRPSFLDFLQKQYKVKLTVSGNRVDVTVNGVRFASTAIRFSPRHLFIGYQSVRNEHLTVSAQLRDLSIK